MKRNEPVCFDRVAAIYSKRSKQSVDRKPIRASTRFRADWDAREQPFPSWNFEHPQIHAFSAPARVIVERESPDQMRASESARPLSLIEMFKMARNF